MAERKNSKTIKVPSKVRNPSNVEVERIILGAIMVNPNLTSNLSSIKKEDFSGEDPRNVLVFEAMQELIEHNKPVDLASVYDQLLNSKTFESAGGSSYINELINTPVNYEDIDHYIGILRNQGVLREFLMKIEQIQKEYSEGKASDISEFMSSSTQALSEISSKRQVAAFKTAKNVAEDTGERIKSERRRGGNNGVTGITTGFSKLNRFTHGWQPGNLIILAARPGMGKTALMLNFALTAAKKTGKTIAIFSCEMSNDLIMKRMLAKESMVSVSKLQTGILGDRDMEKINSALTDIGKTKMYFDDTPNQALGDIVAKAQKLKSENPDLAMIFVDYINIIGVEEKAESRNLEIAIITKTLKQLSRTLNIPVMALTQVSRDADKNDNHMPSLANLKESGSIEQDADLVMFIYRQAYYKNQGLTVKGSSDSEEKQDAQAPTMSEKAVLSVAKNRNGQQGKIDVMFTGQYQRFDEVDDDDQNSQIASQFLRSPQSGGIDITNE